MPVNSEEIGTIVVLSFFKTVRSSSYTFLRKTTTTNNFFGNGHEMQVLCLSGST